MSYFYYPYEWRKDLTPTAAGLSALIDEALQKSGKDKVVILAHSMGGLVARNYLLRYGSAKVDQVITLGTPYLGSAKAVKVLEVGDQWGVGWHPWGDYGNDIGVGMHPKQMKKLVQNMGGAYELVPSRGWFNPVSFDVNFDPSYIVRSSLRDGQTTWEALAYRESANFVGARHNAYLMGVAERFHDQGVGDMSLLTNQYYAQRIAGTELPTSGRISFSPRQVCVTIPLLGLVCVRLPALRESARRRHRSRAQRRGDQPAARRQPLLLRSWHRPRGATQQQLCIIAGNPNATRRAMQ